MVLASPLPRRGSGAGGEGQPAHPNAVKPLDAHVFCPPLNPRAGEGQGVRAFRASPSPISCTRSHVLSALQRAGGRGRPRSQAGFGRALPAPRGVPAGRDARAFPGVVCGRGRPRSQVWSAGGDARALPGVVCRVLPAPPGGFADGIHPVRC